MMEYTIKRKLFYNNLVRWWGNIDRYIVCVSFLLLACSLLFVAASSYTVAHRVGIDKAYIITRQILYVVCALIVIIWMSKLTLSHIRMTSLIGFCISVCLMVLVKLYGQEIKGAKRWISILGVSIQPSEFIKPFFLVVSGWLLSLKFSLRGTQFAAIKLNIIVYLLVFILLATQPDIGMLILITASWFLQLFVCGMPALITLGVIFVCAVGAAGVYISFPHVKERVNSFLFGQVDQNYQISKSLLAFKKGGLYGLGPGGGAIKNSLPDAHTDFIFAVIGEEFGAVTCIIISCMFCFITIRTLLILLKNKNDLCSLIVGVGIALQLNTQALINIAVTLNLIPTKGMTLPLISYGGSSMLSSAFVIGVLLALTRKNENIKYNVLKFKV